MATKQDSQSTRSLPPCRYSTHCTDQYSPDKSSTHNRKYSHPCRFSELCKDIYDVSHSTQFTHTKHDVPQCQSDGNCSKTTDPVHRYTFRHRGLPDLLYPCRYQERCQNTAAEHREKYSHGENLGATNNKESSSGYIFSMY